MTEATRSNIRQLVSVAGISERDIDLMLLEEFWSCPDFREWFVKTTMGSNAKITEFLGAKRSVTGSMGESDLEVAFRIVNGQVIKILIENKVNASFQRDQASRYRTRGDAYIEARMCQSYQTVLIAPKSYLGSDRTARGFDVYLSYEELLNWFGNAHHLGDRRFYKENLLLNAIEKSSIGYQLIEDAPVTNFWRSYHDSVREFAPQLQMNRPAGVPAGSGFIYLHPVELVPGVNMVHKLSRLEQSTFSSRYGQSNV